MSTTIVSAPAGDEPLYEVVGGRRVELPPMSAYATWIASRLQSRLDVHVEDRGLGTVVSEMLFILDRQADLRRRPDVAFVAADRWPLDRQLPPTGDWDVVPNLAVEVVSPHDEFQTVLEKVHEYFRYGTQRVWAIVPEHRQVYVYRSPTSVHILSEAERLSAGDLLPEFEIAVASLFQRKDVESTGKQSKT